MHEEIQDMERKRPNELNGELQPLNKKVKIEGKETKEVTEKWDEEKKGLECVSNIVKIIAEYKLKDLLKSSIPEDFEDAAIPVEESEFVTHEQYEKIVNVLSVACFKRLRHVLKNALNRTICSTRHVFTSDDFRAGCKYYDFEHPYSSSSGSHILEILRKEDAAMEEDNDDSFH